MHVCDLCFGHPECPCPVWGAEPEPELRPAGEPEPEAEPSNSSMEPTVSITLVELLDNQLI